MISEIVKSVVEVLKLAPRYLAALALIAGVLIFLPVSWLEVLGLKAFSIEHRSWLGLVLLVSLGICAVSAAIRVIEAVGGAFHRRGVRRFVAEKLNRLTEGEKQILRFYFAKGTRSNTLRVDDGEVRELVACRILYRASEIGNLLEGFAHNISDFAWDYIHAHPEVLQGSTNTYRTDRRETFW